MPELAEKINQYLALMEFDNDEEEVYCLKNLLEKFSGTDDQKAKLTELVSLKRKNNSIEERDDL